VIGLSVALMVAAYPLLRKRFKYPVWDTTDGLAVLRGAATLTLLSIDLPLDADHCGSHAPSSFALVLRVLRPLAVLALWGVLALCLCRDARRWQPR
jgi:hypothetical protein